MAQQGFVYEQNAANYLKKMNLVKSSFTPAGAGHDQPDLVMTYNGQDAGVELKITDASAGSLVVKYHNGQWGFGDIKPEEKEKLFIRDLAMEYGVLDRIKKEWKEEPLKRTPKDSRLDAQTKGLNPQQKYDIDKAKFTELKGDLPASKIEEYYNKKDTHYVNIGTHGFYVMGNRDPLKLNNRARKFGLPTVPKFSQNATAKYRVRVQSKGSGNYQFTFEMAFSVRTKSFYNIAPLRKGSVLIVESEASLGIFN